MENTYRHWHSDEVHIDERDPDVNTFPNDKPAGAYARLQRKKWKFWYNSAQQKLWVRKDPRINDWSLLYQVGVGDNWGTQVAQTNTTLSGNGTVASPLRIAQQGATTGQVLKWNGTSWVPQNDLGDNWGTQVAVTTPRLTGNGTTASPLEIAQQGATTGQVMTWNGTSWVPSAFVPTRKFRSVQTLNAGNNVVNFSPSLITSPVMVEVRDNTTGALTAHRVVAEALNSVTINVPVTLTNQRITIIG